LGNSKPVIDAHDLKQKCNPAPHIPRFNFALGRALTLQLTLPSSIIEPIHGLDSREDFANSQRE
jgi:hypothetical protein